MKTRGVETPEDSRVWATKLLRPSSAAQSWNVHTPREGQGCLLMQAIRRTTVPRKINNLDDDSSIIHLEGVRSNSLSLYRLKIWSIPLKQRIWDADIWCHSTILLTFFAFPFITPTNSVVALSETVSHPSLENVFEKDVLHR